MSNKQDILSQLSEREKELEVQIRDLSEKLRAVRTLLAGLRSKFKVGDLVTRDGGVTVFEVQIIAPGYGVTPKIFMAKIRKDGKPGQRQQEMWSFQMHEYVLATKEGDR